MAKKGQRILIALKCDVCKAQNYITEKNKLNTKDKLQFNKISQTLHSVKMDSGLPTMKNRPLFANPMRLAQGQRKSAKQSLGI